MGSWSARIPSALAALLLLAVTVAIGHRLFPGTRTGLVAGIALATTGRFFWQARWAEPDMLFSAGVGLAVLGWLLLRDGKPAAGLPVAVLGLAGAILSKGPVLFAIVIPGILTGTFLLPRPRRRGAVLWFAVAWLAAVGIVSIWLLLAVRRGYPLGDVLHRQVVERAESGLHHRQPWHYYLWNLPVDLMPWTVFLPAAILDLRRDGRFRRERLWLAVWPAVVLALFSLSPEKRSLYLLPVLPALALWIGSALERAWLPSAGVGDGDRPAGPSRRRGPWIALGLASALFVLAAPFLRLADARGKSNRAVAEELVRRAEGCRSAALQRSEGSPAVAFYAAPVLGEKLVFLPNRQAAAAYLRGANACILLTHRAAGEEIARALGDRAEAIPALARSNDEWLFLKTRPSPGPPSP